MGWTENEDRYLKQDAGHSNAIMNATVKYILYGFFVCEIVAKKQQQKNHQPYASQGPSYEYIRTPRGFPAAVQLCRYYSLSACEREACRRGLPEANTLDRYLRNCHS